MSVPQKIVFGEWLPDLPELDNPGLLECENLVPQDGAYKPYQGLGAAIVTVPATVLSAYYSDQNATYFFGTSTQLYRWAGATAVATVSAATYFASTNWRFARFDDLLIAASNTVNIPQFVTMPSIGNFATLGSSVGTAPALAEVGVIGRFVVLGSGTEAYVRWSSIDSPKDWPTPNSATAVATQAGEQFLDGSSGVVTRIVGGDQFGIIFQVSGLTRVSYVGGDIVFQFDKIIGAQGTSYNNSVVQVGSYWYYAASDGFYRTNGVTAECISIDKCSSFFQNLRLDASYSYQVHAQANYGSKHIFWYFRSTANPSVPDSVIAYNYVENKFSYCKQSLQAPVVSEGLDSAQAIIRGVNSSSQLANFNTPSATGIATTTEVELNPGGRYRLTGIKPLAKFDGAVSLPAPSTGWPVTFALGSRKPFSQGFTAATYTAYTTHNERTGLIPFLSDSQRHRFRMRVLPSTTLGPLSVYGFEYFGNPSGEI